LVKGTPRRFSRKEERGTTVVVVVLVTTLITAIGIFAVRNVSQIDMAVGFSRQSGQSLALAELGTTAALTQIGSDSSNYASKMSGPEQCLSNGPYATDHDVTTCHKLNRADLEAGTAVFSGETLLEPTATGETGSFGPLANTTGVIEVEMTDRHNTGEIIPGSKDTAMDITLTTMATVSPIVAAGSDPCDGVASMSVKKVMRAHMLVTSDAGNQ
jgi:hypothetical protein